MLECFYACLSTSVAARPGCNRSLGPTRNAAIRGGAALAIIVVFFGTLSWSAAGFEEAGPKEGTFAHAAW